MDEISRYAVGLDVGTAHVRAVVASISGGGNLNVIGYGDAARWSRECVGTGAGD